MPATFGPLDDHLYGRYIIKTRGKGGGGGAGDLPVVIGDYPHGGVVPSCARSGRMGVFT